jgi:ubiquinol-cytochrome c reductase cytochrome b subunit
MWGSGGNDIIASTFHISLNALTWTGRFSLFILPPIAFTITKRICIALQKRDDEAAAHGYETGIVRRLPSGEYIEVHAPLPERHQPMLVPVETTTFGQLAMASGHGELVPSNGGEERRSFFGRKINA